MPAVDLDACGPDTGSFAFQPNADRARVVEAKVRAGLADSLAAALRALNGEIVSSGDDLIAHVRASPVSPVVFGAYTELVEAIFSDDTDAMVKIANELCAPDFGRVGGLRFVTLSDGDLGEGQAARYRRLVDDDPELVTDLRPLTPAEFASASERAKAAIALLDAAAPELAGEFHALVREIVLVETVDGLPFGASSFQLWGALFLKLNPQASRVEIAESLAHESAHALLFGFGMGKPLVENQAEERYPSPLRGDPRPMDGVVHATYVIARMHYTMSQLLASGLLTEEEERAAREAKERNAGHYANGWAVIDHHARWTPAGEAALTSARAYMTAIPSPA